MRTRVGKIARLPKEIRDELNGRLESGEPGKQLVEWLNELPKVKKVLAEQFGGSPVTEQNLSEWRQGGFQDWLKRAETRDLVGELVEECKDLGKAAGGTAIGDRLANVLSAELARSIQALLSQECEPQERWSRLQQALQEVSRLRRDDHDATRTAMKEKRGSLDFQLLLEKERKNGSRV